MSVVVDNINFPTFLVNDDGVSPNTENLKTEQQPYTDQPYQKKYKASIPRGADKSILEDGIERKKELGGLPHSQFSDYHLFRFKQLNGTNYPKTNIESREFNDTLYKDLTPQDLIDRDDLGAGIYKPEDFIYIERLNKLPLNRMLTLRRFAFPVVDDIFSVESGSDEPDISRMITFADQETNKLTELMGFSFGMNWKELPATFESMNMHGANSGMSGYMGSVLKMVDPTFGQDSVKGVERLQYNPMHDSNKVWGMVDSINSTHIRDVGLNFDQDVKLVFNYKMKSYNGINGRSAFMDLLSNILVSTTNDAKFWGGSRFWLGRRPTKFLKNMKFLAPTDFNDFLNKAHVEFKGFLGKGSGDAKKDAVNTLKNVAKNVFNMGFGALLDKIGRPGIPYSNSLLTGNPVGAWHLTIGNPLNPAMVIGNLILKNTVISFGETLGRDDFPEDIKVECTLKHAMPRGRAEIEQMFNFGRGRMYWKPEDVMESAIGAKSEVYKSGLEKDIRTGKNIQTISEFVTRTNSKFGKFNKADILRNAEKVYSFEQIDKK